MSTTSDISPDFPYESKFIAYSEKLKKSPIPKLLI